MSCLASPSSRSEGRRSGIFCPLSVTTTGGGIVAALQSGEAMQFDAIGERADGAQIDVSIGLAPHRGPLGNLSAMSAIIRDISESKKIQRLQNEFLAMTSHELRTPLTAIRGHAQLMLRRGTYQQSHLDAIVAATDQLGRLIEDLLLASRLEADRFDLRLSDVDLMAVVRSAVEQMAGATGTDHSPGLSAGCCHRLGR